MGPYWFLLVTVQDEHDRVPLSADWIKPGWIMVIANPSVNDTVRRIKPLAFSNPRRPNARSKAGYIFISWNTLPRLRANHAMERHCREERSSSPSLCGGLVKLPSLFIR